MNMNHIYTIRVREHLDPSWSERLQGLKIHNRPDGTTALTGEIRDQAALHGLLAQIRELGLELLAVQQIEQPEDEEAAEKKNG